MSRLSRHACARPPVAVFIAANELALVDRIVMHLQHIAHDVVFVSLSRAGQTPPDTVVEYVLSSWPCMTRLHLAGLRRPSTEDGLILEHLTVLHYRHELMFSDSHDLFRLLQSIPNLQELKLVSVVGELQDTAAPPACRLQIYSYHTKLPPSAQWYYPLINSRGSLRELSIILSLAPSAHSLLAAAEIVGPSLEVLYLKGTTGFISAAEALVPRCVRLRELTLCVLVLDANVDRAVALLISGLRAPLRRLTITMPPGLVALLGRIFEADVPASLRALRELRPLPSVDRDIAVSHVLALSRACTLRRIRFDSLPLLDR